MHLLFQIKTTSFKLSETFYKKADRENRSAKRMFDTYFLFFAKAAAKASAMPPPAGKLLPRC